MKAKHALAAALVLAFAAVPAQAEKVVIGPAAARYQIDVDTGAGERIERLGTGILVKKNGKTVMGAYIGQTPQEMEGKGDAIVKEIMQAVPQAKPSRDANGIWTLPSPAADAPVLTVVTPDAGHFFVFSFVAGYAPAATAAASLRRLPEAAR